MDLNFIIEYKEEFVEVEMNMAFMHPYFCDGQDFSDVIDRMTISKAFISKIEALGDDLGDYLEMSIESTVKINELTINFDYGAFKSSLYENNLLGAWNVITDVYDVPTAIDETIADTKAIENLANQIEKGED